MSEEKKVEDAAAPAATSKGDYDVVEHLQSIEDVATLYGTGVNVTAPPKSPGLSSEEAARRLEKNGPNRLTPPPEKPEWLMYLLQYTNPLLILLVIAAILTFVAYAVQTPKDSSTIILAVTLCIVIVLLATASYLNERAAGSVTAQLRNLLPAITLVIRDGHEKSINASELVVGDVVHLTVGTRVPADAKIIESRELKLDFSSLTGESNPIPMFTTAQDNKAHESKHVAFMSSQVLNGEGWGIVIRCGDGTFIGKISALAGTTAGTKTTLQNDMERFVKFIAIIACSMAVVLFSAGMGRKMDFVDAFVNGLIVVLVANIPEGLPATVTSALTLTAVRMKEVSVLVKRTDIVENLGAATRIASDKTGTLTQNRMTVMNCWVNRHSKSAAEVVSSAGRLRELSHRRYSMTRAQQQLALARASRAAASGQLSAVELQSPASGKRALSVSRSLRRESGKLGSSVLARLSKPLARGSKFGNDMLSRMSMGKPPATGLVRRSTLSTPSVMVFAINASSQPPPNLAEGSLWDQFSPFSKLVTIAAVNNKAQFEVDDESSAAGGASYEERKVLGDATDSGLLRFCDKIIDVDDVRDAFAAKFTIPFSSKNKWAATMAVIPGDHNHYLVMIKGAPEYVMKRCSHYSYRGAEHPMDDAFLGDVMDALEAYGALAERVIGHAAKVVPADKVPSNEAEAAELGLLDGFTFCGLLSLIDPPREAVPPAVTACRSAGIGVVMVTGDHPLTAEAIARKCNIITQLTRREVAAMRGVEEAEVPLEDPSVRALVLSGAMLDDLKTDADWDVVMGKDELVFARTTPQQKLQIVSHFQRLKEIVAVTGDGVNDAPALRKANIGVAMGNPDSSEVAREAADVVLLDDNFASLVAAIAEGRTLYDNLKKTVAYTLAHILPEALAVVLTLAFGMPLGLAPLLVLCIDLVTEQGPATSLTYEPAEANVMDRPPRFIEKERLVSFPLLFYSYVVVGLAEGATCFGAYLWTYKHNGVDIADIFLLDPKDNTWLLDAEDIDDAVVSNGQVFDVERQQDIARQANSAWFISLILCQFWHIWFCKTRRMSVFQHRGMYENHVTFYGVSLAVAIMLVCVYVPWLQDHVFFTANPPGVQAWVPHLFFLAFIFVYTEATKAQARKNPNGFVSKWLVW